MDPLSALKEGGLPAVAVLLFLGNYVQLFTMRKSNEALVNAVTKANEAAAAANQTVATKLTDMARTLAEGQEKSTEMLAAVIRNQEILATNQMNLTHTNNEVVRELITIIRDGERS